MKIKIYKTIILPVVLYGCETWSLTLGEECRLRVFENRILRRIFGPKRNSSRFNHPDYIRWTIQTMKFLIVEPSPLPIRILFGPNVRPGILFSNTLSLHSSPNAGDYVSQPFSTTGNITVWCILILKKC